MQYGIFKLHRHAGFAPEYKRLSHRNEPEYAQAHDDYHATFRAALNLAKELESHGACIVGCHSDHIAGHAEIFLIIDGRPEEYAVREIES